MCLHFSENWPEMASNETVMLILLSNPNLADILGDTYFDFESFYLLEFVDPRFPGPWPDLIDLVKNL